MAVTKFLFPLQWTVLIPLVPTMEFVTRANVFAKQDGKELAVNLWTNKFSNVYPVVLSMACTTLPLALALVILCGQDLIALKVCNKDLRRK